jgi:Actin-fragmin kinase, catalytic.
MISNTNEGTREFNIASPPIWDIDNIQWDAIKAIKVSDSGSNGVIFIETLFGAVAVKGSTDPCVEYLGYQLFKALNIAVPEMRVYEWVDPEYNKIVEALEKFGYEDRGLWSRISPRIKTPFLYVMEYIAGNDLYLMSYKKSSKYLDPNTPEGKNRLIKFGMIVATDTLTNVYDRYPMIWDNDGNFENLIFAFKTNFHTTAEEIKDPNNVTLEMKDLYAIDNRIVLFNNDSKIAKQNYDRYMARLSKCIQDIIEYLKQIRNSSTDLKKVEKNCERLKQIVSIINETTGYCLIPQGEFYIATGMCIGWINGIDLPFDKVQKIYDDLAIFPKDDYMNGWAEGFKTININMFADTQKVAKDIIGDVDGWVEWLTQYASKEHFIRFNDEKKNMSRKKLISDMSDEELFEHFGTNHEEIKYYLELSQIMANRVNEEKKIEEQELEEIEELNEAGRKMHLANKNVR